MLLSCLVDADYTTSLGHLDSESESLEPERLLRGLYEHMQTLRENSGAEKTLNSMRDEVFRQCGDAGEMAPGLFTLTAPTGIGKTLALLHFALRHCAAHSKRRIILVLPYLTLTEQSQREYEKLVPHILADHSQSRLSEEERELASRWDAPFIITTSVRFFESLFASRPRDCRKLHNIAQSVVLFDEAQSLPVSLLSPTLKPMEELFAFPPRFYVQNPTAENYQRLFQLTENLWVPFSRYVFNSVFVSVAGTADTPLPKRPAL